MPKFIVSAINVPVERWEVQTKYIIELNPEEAQYLMLMCGKVAGDPRTKLRTLIADPIYNEFKSVLKMQVPDEELEGTLTARLNV